MAFLDCMMWSVFLDDVTSTNHYLVESVYYHRSDISTPREVNPITVHIPDFEIHNKHLLEGLNYDLINQYKIPVVKKLDDETWTIDLTHYERQNNLL